MRWGSHLVSAMALAAFDNGAILLDGLEALSAETANALAGCEEGFLSLNGLKKRIPDVAQA